MKKLGESTFAEVFHGMYRGKNVAVKIIPFGGNTLVNGFQQTHPDDGRISILHFEEMLFLSYLFYFCSKQCTKKSKSRNS